MLYGQTPTLGWDLPVAEECRTARRMQGATANARMRVVSCTITGHEASSLRLAFD